MSADLDKRAKLFGFGSRGLTNLAAAPASAAYVRDAAVVDVGSNSIRLVIYRVEGRAITPILNERASVGLGRDLRTTGVLSPQGVVDALAALERFRLFLDARGVADVIAVATAAVRDASDGPAFANRVGDVLRTELRVLSGAEEAHASALGVVAADPTASGVVADLGGSSLELAAIDHGAVDPGVSLPLGPLALASAVGSDLKAARKLVDSAIADVSDAIKGPRDTLYAVGGAWRAFARIALERRAHPVRVLHAYEISATEAIDLSKFVAKQSAASLASVPEVSRRRAEALPLAAVVLERTIKRLGVRRIRVQAYGLREGLLFERMGEDERAGDPLIAGVDALTRRVGGVAGVGPALEAWLAPVRECFDTPFPADRDRILFAAACRAADLGGRHHPDHRAELGALEVLYAPVAGVSHPERVFLALVVHHRYGGRREPVALRQPLRLLDDDAQRAAMRLGLGLRFACTFSSRATRLLEHAAIETTDDHVVLHLTDIGRGLYTSVAERRFQQFASAVEKVPRTTLL